MARRVQEWSCLRTGVETPAKPLLFILASSLISVEKYPENAAAPWNTSVHDKVSHISVFAS